MSYKSSYTGIEIDAAVGKPATSSTDNALVRFDGTSGAMQNSNATINDDGTFEISKATQVETKVTSGSTSLTTDVFDVGATYVQTNAELTIGTTGGNDLILRTAGTERMRIDENGHVIAPYGITLGTAAGTYAAANTLDDYEEGTFTPVVRDASGNAATAVAITGIYTKIGNTVTFYIRIININTSGLTSSSQIYIDGFPFSASPANTGWNVYPVKTESFTSTTGSLFAHFVSGTKVSIANSTTSGNSAALVSQITSGASDFWLTGTYPTA